MSRLLAFSLLLAACGSKAPPPAALEQTVEEEAPPDAAPPDAEAAEAAGPPAGTPTTFANIVDVEARSGGAVIVFDGGTNLGIQAAWNGRIVNLAGSSFTVSACNAKTCRATVSVSLTRVTNGSLQVELWP